MAQRPLAQLATIPFLIVASLLFSPMPLPAQTGSGTPMAAGDAKAKIAHVVSELERVRSIPSVALSPDGAQLAWVVGGKGEGSGLVLASAHGEHARAIAGPGGSGGAGCSEESLAWSPDAKRLAFLGRCGGAEQPQIYVLDAVPDATGGPGSARELTHLKGGVASLEWAPDGKHIGFLHVPNATRAAGALAAMKPPSGVIGVEGLEIQHAAAADAATGEVTTLTPDTLHVYEFAWSPDAKKIAYVAAPAPGENNWWVAKLYTEDVFGNGGTAAPSKEGGRAAFDPGALLDPVTVSGPLHGLQIAVPRWSPDGKTIALIGGLMSDQGMTGGDIYLVPAAGGAPRNITADVHLTPAWLAWEKDCRSDCATGGTLVVSAVAGGEAQIGRMRVAGGEFEDAMKVPGSLGDGRLHMSLSLAKDGSFAVEESSFAKAPEVYTGQIGKGSELQQVTHLNEALKPAWGKAESVRWSNDSFDVQGWLIEPENYDPAKKYPMIVMVHGGPSSAVLPHWPGVGYGGVPFSSLGYFVLMPNPRGSYGEGERFTKANIKDFGYGDMRDVLAGVDAVEKKYPVDDKRLGLTGWSYGGFMTMFGVTQTQRFHAAVAGAGIANWQSYYGENSIDQWMTPFFGASVYQDSKVYAKSSAIDFIRQVKTPTLVVVGDRDGECPAPQSFEFWHALKAEGVPTELVVYPDEGHAFRSPEHRRDVLERALGWFDRYLSEGS